MTIHQTDDGNPLLHENNYSSKVFWLNIASGYEIDMDNLKDELNGQIFREDISNTVDMETTYVPDIFYDNGRLSKSSNIDHVQITSSNHGDVLSAEVTLDESKRIKYRNDEVFLMDTKEADFIIFRHDGFYYLVVLGRRSLSESVKDILKNDFKKLGSSINETELDSTALDNIQNRIEAKIQDPYATDYPGKEITGVIVYGDDVEDTEEYKRQRDRGKLRKYMLETEELVPDTSQKLGLSRDGLVRFYSNVTLATYLDLLHKYILPEIKRKSESSPNLAAYEKKQRPIYKEIEMASSTNRSE